ncbi:DMT family transporter [Denitrobaculum tricleocarpae]|uniref:DMT family transporter n=1 Tax=Denitrobaculum tricleocarpae TaxID=2591009 RepID=A0A545T5E4_9PROT|nr:DMT family transporter [Denitrobaculum tricleocarpae]TQV72470.1 DMT family transporter [Denitrobaculum tricleocarpae]
MHNLSDNVRGALFMSISMAGFALNDATIKLISGELGFYQIIFLRGIFATLLIGLLLRQRGALFYLPSRRDAGIMAVRAAGEVGGTLCFLTALFNMPIANATAILQALPLAVTLAAALFMGEKVGWRRYTAIAVGFTGVLIIVRPGGEGFNAYALWAVAAVGFIVLRDLTTRRLSAGIPSAYVALSSSFVLTLVGGLLALTVPWPPVSTSALAMLAGAAGFLFFGYLFAVMTMRVGEVSFVSPFRYSVLIWAILLGLLLFGEVPDGWTLFGSAVVVGMGIYTFYRERRVKEESL